MTHWVQSKRRAESTPYEEASLIPERNRDPHLHPRHCSAERGKCGVRRQGRKPSSG